VNASTAACVTSAIAPDLDAGSVLAMAVFGLTKSIAALSTGPDVCGVGAT
jgi:hypothetical protein